MGVYVPHILGTDYRRWPLYQPQQDGVSRWEDTAASQ